MSKRFNSVYPNISGLKSEFRSLHLQKKKKKKKKMVLDDQIYQLEMNKAKLILTNLISHLDLFKMLASKEIVCFHYF